jgi:hypothetical protein
MGDVARDCTSSSLPTQLNAEITKRLEIAVRRVLHLCSLISWLYNIKAEAKPGSP